MLVRVAPGDRAGHGLTARARRRLFTPLLAAAIAALTAVAGGCAAPPAADVTADWHVTPAEPPVGDEAQVDMTLADGSGQPLRDAKVTVEAHMSHPGMAPVVEPAVDRGNGGYAARLRFTMAGTWTLFVQIESPDRRTLRHRLGDIAARARD